MRSAVRHRRAAKLPTTRDPARFRSRAQYPNGLAVAGSADGSAWVWHLYDCVTCEEGDYSHRLDHRQHRRSG